MDPEGEDEEGETESSEGHGECDGSREDGTHRIERRAN